MTTAAIYVRLSRSRDQDKATESLEGQIGPCRDLAARKGWTVLEPPFVDDDLSAYSGRRRPEFDKLLSTLPGRGRVLGLPHPGRHHRQNRAGCAPFRVRERQGKQGTRAPKQGTRRHKQGTSCPHSRYGDGPPLSRWYGPVP